MAWQDIVLTGGGTVVTLALLPTIFGKRDKPALSTSVVSCLILLIFSFVYHSLSLKLASLVIAINSFLWFVLAVQKYYKKKSKRK